MEFSKAESNMTALVPYTSSIRTLQAEEEEEEELSRTVLQLKHSNSRCVYHPLSMLLLLLLPLLLQCTEKLSVRTPLLESNVLGQEKNGKV
ncbi:hypothetical protein A6R68_21575 [Neotoma lepida]|uniref:Uncharacterized protein n=1 Tax=Neotoma lepida TaxID=56216 RepID=A0A1A6HPP5_NEOLE|nr:hypothetical protein A6R68_21575 [Neotoma lepida]